MRPVIKVCLYLGAAACAAFGQAGSYPYILKNFAGAFPLGDGGPATSALLYYPNAVISDGAGTLFILDSSNYRVRTVTPDGKIATLAQLNAYGYDMKLAPDGNLYVSASSQLLRISPAGVVTVVAGTGSCGYNGDGGAATAAQICGAYGLDVDKSGNIFFTDANFPAYRVREVTTDGKIRTIAGTATNGFNGDNQPATSANLSFPNGIAVDSAGTVYIADRGNYRIRKFTVGGNITTIAGTGTYGTPVNGPAASSRVGDPEGLFFDRPNNIIYLTDASYGAILKITPEGNLVRIAGNLNAYGSPGDGLAVQVGLLGPSNVSVDKAGNIFFVDETHRARQLLLDGTLRTVAGKVHFAGDGGPATAALLNEPTDVVIDSLGNVLIADGYNYRIRRVATDGTIGTLAGNGVPGFPLNNSPVASQQLPYIYAMTTDAAGALYLATQTQVYKVVPNGTLTIVAGNGDFGNAGDGGKATLATFSRITGIAVDSSGNIYVADEYADRVRMISAETGNVTAFAGTGTYSRSGDGGLATAATLRLGFTAPLAVDSKGNVYIADGNNYSVRMVSTAGIISTVVGNGNFGNPDNVQGTAAPFSRAAGMVSDSAGNLYIASDNFGCIYRLSGGVIRRISGSESNPITDGIPALSAYFFTQGIRLDPNGDLYAVDSGGNVVRKLILNTPTKLTVADGDGQTGQPGQSLAKALKVTLAGRAGYGVSGVTVNFAVTSGTATLSATSSQTDASGTAGVAVTITSSGSVVITATAVGTGLPAVQFNESALPAGCAASPPVIASVGSAGDFGGPAGFAAGSWLEVKGSKFSPTTRQWGGADFQGANAPTSLDGISVTINGKKGFVYYISPGQINVQAPADSANGSLQLTVSNCAGTSAPVNVQKAAIAPGLLAPAAFNIGGKQYLVATFSDGFTYVGTAGLIPGVAFKPAAPGDVITAYGIGFGDVTPGIAPGIVVSATNRIPNLTIAFGDAPATVSFAGLAPSAVGLYQFNFTVPNVPDGDYLITFAVGGQNVAQMLYLTVHR